MASNRVPPVGGTTASTSSAGIVQLTDSTSSTSTTTAATPASVKSAYDLANGAIAKTLTTTTGDIIYASSANTPARLGIGSTDQVLKVSGGLPVWGTTSSNFVGVSAGGSRNTTITNGTTYYAMAMNTENFDTDGFHDNVTNNTRITIPSGKGGKYLVIVSLAIFDATNIPGSMQAFIRINGSGTIDATSVSQISLQDNTAGAYNNNNNRRNFGGILNLSAGDYFEVLMSSTNGSGTMSGTIRCDVQYLGA